MFDLNTIVKMNELAVKKAAQAAQAEREAKLRKTVTDRRWFGDRAAA